MALGQPSAALGKCRHGSGIALGVKNLSTWARELVHGADHRLGHLKERGRPWRSETVAEWGGAVLLEIFGHEQKFANFIRFCGKTKAGDYVIVATPHALGDTYDELIESLNRLADAEVQLVIVPRKRRVGRAARKNVHQKG
jgi:hypothetical protein